MIRRIIYMLLGATTAVGCDSFGPLVGVDESGSDPYHLLAYTRAVFDYDVLYPAWLYLYDPVRDTTALLVADSSAFGGISDPQWSPDGDRIAYIRGRSYDSTALWIVDVATTDRRMLSDAAFQAHSPAWSADGSAIAFIDTDEYETGAPGNLQLVDQEDGRPLPLASPIIDASHPAWAPNDHILLVGGTMADRSVLDGSDRGVWLVRPRDEHKELILSTRLEFRGIAWSPRGDRFVVTLRHEDRTIVRVLARDGAHLWYKSIPSGYTGRPRWSPDGAEVCVPSDRGNVTSMHVISADGTSFRTFGVHHVGGTPSWSQSGRRVTYGSWESLQELHLHTGELRSVLSERWVQFADPRWSPVLADRISQWSRAPDPRR